MFSGLVTAVGEVSSLRPSGGGLRLHLRADLGAEAVVVGESIAVQGMCLTASAILVDGFAADVSPETVDRTTVRGLRSGRRVNLERALKLGDRLGGHLVSGHVDAAVAVISVQTRDAFRTLRVALPRALAPEVALKGSVAVDGVSLTVAGVGDGWFDVAVVPATLAATTLAERRAGDLVNLETDVLAKYVRRAVAGQRPGLVELLGEGAWHAED
ncbi:MAG: riboflavin synthase [Thermoanaerobaculaceae bacterium]